MRIWCLFATCFILIFKAHGQLSLKKIPQTGNFNKVSKSNSARTQTTRLTLPFWDDFSYYTSKKPIDSIWSSYNTVTINEGLAVNPVSIKVATFDGYDASGKPYNVGNNGLNKGLADSLVSQFIDLTTISFEQQETLYLSFFYQAQGNGEVPDKSDKLEVFFKSPLGWELIDDNILGGNGADTAFHFKILQVPPRFFHKNFQFKFKNFGRLSGPYDTWNLDYVYLNVNRTPTDSSYPDRTITTSLSSLFKGYWSIPYKHFATNISKNLTNPNFEIYNLKAPIPNPQNPNDNKQPINYYSYYSIVHYKKNLTALTQLNLDINNPVLPPLDALTRRKISLTNLPTESNFDLTADSVSIKIKIGINSGDTVKYLKNYFPIDFKKNDTIRSIMNLSNYYAYDDGTAEYAAGLNQAGSEFAYQFTSILNSPDTLKKILIHFPNFGDTTNQVFEMRIWKSISDTNPILLYKKIVSVNRKSNNQFATYELDPAQPVVLEGTFYIGWKQSTSNRMDVGFDSNYDTGSKIFYNTTGTWTQNTDLKGSLMVRPIFGKPASNTITGFENPIPESFIYPNPNNGVFYIPQEVEKLIIYDLFGREVNFQLDSETTDKRIQITDRSGIFIIKMFIINQWISSRIIIH